MLQMLRSEKGFIDETMMTAAGLIVLTLIALFLMWHSDLQTKTEKSIISNQFPNAVVIQHTGFNIDTYYDVFTHHKTYKVQFDEKGIMKKTETK